VAPAEVLTVADSRASTAYDGLSAADLAARLGVPRLELRHEVASTQDVAHALAAEGAPAGTLVVADAQRAGRGRLGRAWRSPAGAGIWLTLVERPEDAASLDVLSLRLGLHAAAALDPWTSSRVGIKWPNDLHVDGGKLAGILVETRWRGARPDWVAIGFGLNVTAPKDVAGAAALVPGTSRTAVLEALVPALRAAARRTGPLDAAELAAYAQRDLARWRRCVEPVEGRVEGITAAGELLVDTASGRARLRAGSLVFAEGTC
jgi:BirA family transcriptional regulator, biotin operon repressor / biotin---[acetyl-CoA-carboxylase] ligase